ncbi:MAG: phosphoribosyltransferase [Patescibacteria group bacterium]|nr:phosphoribosyltransferase [Patescibacteria group bacterium]
MFFQNRQEAGKKLASEIFKYRKENPFVLAIPKGGVPIGYEIAEVLLAPLEVLVVRKIVLSGDKDFGIGVIAEGGIKILDQTTIEVLGIDDVELKDTIDLEEKELEKRVEIYRGGELPSLTGKTVILADDGMATSMTAKAAVEAVKKLDPKKIIFATPVCVLDMAENLRRLIDDVICLAAPAEFMAEKFWYDNFTQMSDEEILRLLEENRKRNG